jgi:hypothetical protein
MDDRCPHCDNTGTVVINGCRYNCMRCRDRELVVGHTKNPRIRLAARLRRRFRGEH